MSHVQQILDALNQVPASVWQQAIQIVIGALVVSPVALALKKWWKIDGEKVMLGIVMLGSILAPAIVYLQTDPQFAPWFVLVQGWLTFATTQPVYYLFVRPLWGAIEGWFTGTIQQAISLNEVKSAAVPETGLPIGSDTNQK